MGKSQDKHAQVKRGLTVNQGSNVACLPVDFRYFLEVTGKKYVKEILNNSEFVDLNDIFIRFPPTLRQFQKPLPWLFHGSYQTLLSKSKIIQSLQCM